MKYPITKKGKERLEKELSDLKAELRVATREAGDAKKDVHMSKSVENELAIGVLQYKTKRIKFLDNLLANCVVINPADPAQVPHDGLCYLSTYVDLEKKDGGKRAYQIVAEYEADASHGWLSSTSPLGKALLRKRAGDDVIVDTPDGEQEYTVLAVRYEEIKEPEPQPAPVTAIAEDAAEKTAEPEETITEETPAPVAPVGEVPAPSAPQEKTTFWSAALAWVKKFFK